MNASFSKQVQALLPKSDERWLIGLVLVCCLTLASILVFWSPLIAAAMLLAALALAFCGSISYWVVSAQRASGATYGQIAARWLIEIPFALTVLSLFFLPLEDWNTKIKIAGLNVMPILQLFALTLFALAAVWRQGRIKTPALQEPQIVWVGVLTFVILASTAQSVHVAAAVGGTITYITRLLLFFSVIFYVTTTKRISLLIWIIFLGMAISVGHGTLDRLSGVPGRISGLSGQVNRFGTNCATLVPFAVYMFIRRRGTLRWVAGGLVAVFVYGILLSQSRGALFSLSMIMAVMAFHFERGARIRVLAVIFVGLMAFWTVLPPQFIARLQNVSTDVTVQRRVAYLDLAMGMFEERPLLGSGPENFGRTYARSEYRYWLGEDSRDVGRPAHNTFAQILAEFGLLGALSFSVLLGTNLMALHRARGYLLQHDRKLLLPIVEGAQAAIAIYLFSMLFITSHWEPFYWLLAALPVSITLAIKATTKPALPEAAAL